MIVTKFFLPKIAGNELGSISQSQINSGCLLLPHPCSCTPPPRAVSPECSSVYFVHKLLLLWALSWVPGTRKHKGHPRPSPGVPQLLRCSTPHPCGQCTLEQTHPCMTLLSPSQPQHNGNVTASTERKPSGEPRVVRTKCPRCRAEGSLRRLLSLTMCPGWWESPIEWQWLSRASEASLGWFFSQAHMSCSTITEINCVEQS